MNSVQIDLGIVKNTCFVVMPFDPLFQTMYERVIRPTVEQTGIKCVRGDEIYSRPRVMSDIWKSLRESRFVIAELTDRNPNVFYEIGLAHAIGKPIILLTRNEEDVPFDLKALRYTFYNTNNPFWGENLAESLRETVYKVLNEPNLSIDLEGVCSEIEIPQPPEFSAMERVTVPFDISGHWEGSWKRFNARILHTGTLIIAETEDRLTATLLVTFEKKGDQTVVQEMLSGSIIDRQATLEGVSYTYIRQGQSSSYLLDNFDLHLSEDGLQLEGLFRSRRGEGEVLFKRILSD